MCPFELRICMYTDFDLKKKMAMSVWPENPKNLMLKFKKWKKSHKGSVE